GAPRAPGGVGRALPGAERRGLRRGRVAAGATASLETGLRDHPRVRRRPSLLVVVVVVVVFLVISALLARVAWETPGQLPITQCVRVRHTGNPISGMKVELLEISTRIKTNGDCPKEF